MAGSNNYIVYTFSWNENNGGVIFMHNLVHELNRMGERAFPWKAAPIYKPGRRQRLRNWLRPEPLVTNPMLNTPVARRRDLSADSIVIYPELVRGNPLNARYVVRWLLYKPGLLYPFDFGPGEMFFRAGEMSDSFRANCQGYGLEFGTEAFANCMIEQERLWQQKAAVGMAIDLPQPIHAFKVT
ncbi:hypothetical protein [Rhodosalinus sp. 5P4]|uniref:hypothetical protein n=1 Tax=Rhodosalinus sp. 5P4 TaxID=3239196 RepID=UPI0035249A86